MEGFSEPIYKDLYSFTYKEHTFEIGVSYETIKVCTRGVKSEYQDNIYRFSCDKEINYCIIHKAFWVATSKELIDQLMALYEVIRKHYQQDNLTYNDFIKMLPNDFKSKYIFK